MATNLTPFQGSLSALHVGEVGSAQASIKEAIIDMKYDLTASEVGQLSFRVLDPGFNMYNRHYFMVGRSVTYNGINFEVAAVTVNSGSTDEVEVEARTKGVQQMRRSKGPRSWGAISPTQFAATVAAEFGLKFFGEPSPADGEILRNQEDEADESTMDVLSRLAGGLDFRMFEASNTLFFASEAHIIAYQPRTAISVRPSDGDALYPLRMTVRKSVDAKHPATLTASLLKTRSSQLLTPGVGITVRGLADFGQTFMIDKVSYSFNTSSSPVSISGTTVEKPVSVGCSSQTLFHGAIGPCVSRIQTAVGSPPTGIFDTATREAVIRFQVAHKINPDGVVGAGTWRAIEGT